MVEFAERLDFGLEAAAKALFVSQVGREELDGGRLARLAVDRFVDRPHAAPAEFADDLVGSKAFDFHVRGKERDSGVADAAAAGSQGDCGSDTSRP